MKTTKRLIAMAAALTLTACAAAPITMMNASAATANTVTITNQVPNTDVHKYDVYKIFSGTVDSTNKLTGIAFAGGDTNFETFLTNLENDTVLGSDFSGKSTPVEVAAVLSGYTGDDKLAKRTAFAKFVNNNATLVSKITGNDGSASPISITDDGYYLIVEKPTSNVPEGVGMTSYLLTQYDASSGVDINAKASVPSVEKKIKENETSKVATVPKYGEGYNDTADYCIGDTVPFELIGTLPDTYASYDSYKYIFHDKLGTEFTKNNDIKVYVKNGDTETEVSSTLYDLTVATGDTITVTIDDVKLIKDSSNNPIVNKDSLIYVRYTAVLNSNAVIGRPGQTNEVYLEYSNNPNIGASGTTSKTPTDKVVAFTYELDVTKIDSISKAELSGAQFVLYKKINNIDYFANFNNDSKILDWVPGSYADTAFTKNGNNINGTDATSPSLTSGAEFKFVGLDDGTYFLKEIVAPETYNKLTNDIQVEIVADTSNGQNEDADGTELVKLELKVNGTSKQAFDADDNNVSGLSAGVLSTEVENTSGTQLPTTGGTGTKVLYAIGGTILVGAGMVLVSKKRAQK